MKKLYVVDISSLFFRSYYAISLNMTNEKGEPTNALYGTIKMLSKLIKEKSPDFMIVCFDTKEPSFRQDIFPEYKANRGEMPEDLEQQVPYLKEMMEVLQIPYLEKPGFEADDLIGTVVSYGQKNKLETYIVSGDKDFAQLVDKKTFLYDTMKNIVYNSQGVQEKWGVKPSQMLDYFSLVGDSSDNIPGVRGIGPKGACNLLSKYKTLDNIYKNISSITGSTKDKLKDNKKEAYLAKKLIALKTNMPLRLTEKKISYKPFKDFSQKDKDQLKNFLERLNFKSLLTSFDLVKSETPKPQKTKVEIVSKNFLKEEEFIKSLEAYPTIWLMTQEDSLCLFCNKKITVIKPKSYPKIAQHLDQKWARYAGYNLKSSWKKLGVTRPVAEWDSMIADHLLTSESSQSFKRLCEIYLKTPVGDQFSIGDIFKLHFSLRDHLEDNLKNKSLIQTFKEIELPTIGVLYRMEKQGVLLDIKETSKQSKNLDNDIKKLEQAIYKSVGEEFNVSSPKQLASILFDKLKLPKGRKTKSGYSTDSHELTKIKDLHPVLPFIIEHREIFKLKTTYTDSFLSLVDSKTKRIHTQFRQASTSTGRLSSVNPNLQNLPIRTERGREVRKCFKAPQGYKLISADYSQIELRILAHITEDPGLVRAFEQDLDIHTATASEIFNIPLKKVTPELRRKSKAVNFGIAYGQGVYGLAQSLGISREESREIIGNYFKKFKKIRDYIESTKKQIHKQGFVQTLFGRKRFFHKADLKNPRMKSIMERAAINAPLQGSASDLVKKAMIQLDGSLPISLLSQVHDELLFECPEDSVDFESQQLVSIMENCVTLKIPLKVNVAVGQDWKEAHI